MKYVIFKRGDKFLPVMFPEHVIHAEVKFENATVHSAGFYKLFVSVDQNSYAAKVDMFKESVSLGMGPSGVDSIILTMALNGFPAEEFTEKRIN